MAEVCDSDRTGGEELLLVSSDGGKLGVVIGERRLFPRRPPVEVIRRIC